MSVLLDVPVVASQVNHFEVVAREEQYSEGPEYDSGEALPFRTVTIRVATSYDDGSTRELVATVSGTIRGAAGAAQGALVCEVRSYREEVLARSYQLANDLSLIPAV